MTFPNIFFTFGGKKVINYGCPMMKGWRIITLKEDGLKEKGGRKKKFFGNSF